MGIKQKAARRFATPGGFHPTSTGCIFKAV